MTLLTRVRSSFDVHRPNALAEAAKLMIEKPQDFQRNVKASLRGGYHMGRNFPALIK